jgi:hypothetical protein
MQPISHEEGGVGLSPNESETSFSLKSPRRGKGSDLLRDERWLLVQRILASSGFQRADQLRKILLYISRRAILRPEDPIREYEIACDVLGRRSDFDPASDNIVRVQISHLRRKLEVYFNSEGSSEQLLVTIPRGSYAASFESSTRKTPLADVVTEPAHLEIEDLDKPADLSGVDKMMPYAPIPWSSREVVLLASLVVTIVIGSFAFVLKERSVTEANRPESNAFLRPLLSNHKNISVILPDTPLMIIQTLLKQDVPIDDYMANFPQKQLAGVDDPALRQALIYLAGKRATTFSEASIGANLIEHLSRVGANADLRYSRDLHVQDLGDGNAIIIGSRRANPWASLFTEQTNFQFIENENDHNFYFTNAKPDAGEESRYIPDYSRKDRVVSYVDIALTHNLTHSGYILLINGSDVQATEAAARLMLGGSLPTQVKTLFDRRELGSYEIFLRGTHINGEAEDKFEIVAIRPEGQ